MNRNRHRTRLLLILLAAAGLILASGCQTKEEIKEQLSFQFTLPQGWRVINMDEEGRIPRLDTNGDGELEWVLLYSFDHPPDAKFQPVRCAIYHVVRREPKFPIVYPYHLQAPGWTYLGEGGADRVTLEVADVVTEIAMESPNILSATEEVIVRSATADKLVTQVSIFQWRDNVNDPFQDPHEVLLPYTGSEQGQWYQCIGLFRATISVDVEKDRVTVRNRLNDRSQLARVNVYRPSGGPRGYLDAKDQLVAPVSSCVDFAYGMPEDVAQSPYPEKVVLAFQNSFAQEPDYGNTYLTAAAREKRDTDDAWRIFSAQGRTNVKGLCVKGVGYDPAKEIRAERERYSVDVRGQGATQESPPISSQIETLVEYTFVNGPAREIAVIWQLIREGNTWKIDGIQQIRDAE